VAARYGCFFIAIYAQSGWKSGASNGRFFVWRVRGAESWLEKSGKITKKLGEIDIQV
jgi:hypothetical protein